LAVVDDVVAGHRLPASGGLQALQGAQPNRRSTCFCGRLSAVQGRILMVKCDMHAAWL
jgi:hypothetical protein